MSVEMADWLLLGRVLAPAAGALALCWYGIYAEGAGLRRRAVPLLLYAGLALALVSISPLSALFGLYAGAVYQPWELWDALPRDGILALALVLVFRMAYMAQHSSKQSVRQREKSLGIPVILLSVLFILFAAYGINGLLYLRYDRAGLSLAEARQRMQAASSALDGLESDYDPREYTLWAPRDVLYAARLRRRPWQLCYGRDIFYAPLDAQTYDTYTQSHRDMAAYLELWTEAEALSVAEADLDGAEFMAMTAREAGANLWLLPKAMPEQLAQAMARAVKGRLEEQEGYWRVVLYGEAGA